MSTNGYEPMPKDDAVAFFGCCSDRFGELAALFDVIAGRINEHDDLHKLATLGKDTAREFEDVAGSCRDQLEKGGVRP